MPSRLLVFYQFGIVLVCLLLLPGCGRDQSVTPFTPEPPTPCVNDSLVIHEFGPSVRPYHGEPTVVLPGGGLGEFWQRGFDFHNTCRGLDSYGGAVLSLVLSPVGMPDSVYMESLLITTPVRELSEASRTMIWPIISATSDLTRIERLALLRDFIDTNRRDAFRDGGSPWSRIFRVLHFPKNPAEQDSVWREDMSWGLSEIHP